MRKRPKHNKGKEEMEIRKNEIKKGLAITSPFANSPRNQLYAKH